MCKCMLYNAHLILNIQNIIYYQVKNTAQEVLGLDDVGDDETDLTLRMRTLVSLAVRGRIWPARLFFDGPSAAGFDQGNKVM